MFPALLLALLVSTTPQDPTPAPGARFGMTLLALPDLDGDGVFEFAVGAPYDRSGSRTFGAVLVFSGAERELLRRIRRRSDIPFGSRLLPYDDLDRDGTEDLLVACGRSDQWWVVSPSTGESLTGLRGGPLATTLGVDGPWELATVGDLDGDGRTDLAGGQADGLHWISGRTHDRLQRTGERCITSVLAGIADRDGDGVREVVVAVYESESLRIVGTEVHFSGGDDVLALEAAGSLACPAGDHDEDGLVDVLVATDDGLAVCSGRTGSVLLAVDTHGSRSLLAGEDLNGDGVADLVTGTGGLGGAVVAYSGRTSARLWTVQGELNAKVGTT